MVKTKTSINPVQLNVVNQTPYLDIASSPDVENKDAEKIDAKGVVLFDPQGGGVFGSTNPINIKISDPTTPTLMANVVFHYATLVAGARTVSGNMIDVFSTQAYFDPANAYFDAARTPTIWKSALVVNAGATVIWAAVAGKKHRIMGIRISLVSGTTAAAASLLTLLDAAAATGIGVQVCGAALAASPTTVLLVNETYMNGLLSAAVNTDWNINLSAALAVAGVFVQVWGTEE